MSVLTPDELIERLAGLGISVSRSTLHRWTRERLLPRPETGSYGHARGRYTHYPVWTVGDAAAAAWLTRQRRLHLREIRDIRDAVYTYAKWWPGREFPDEESLEAWSHAFDTMLHNPLARAWAIHAGKALKGWEGDHPANVRIKGVDEEGSIIFEVKPATQTRVLPRDIKTDDEEVALKLMEFVLTDTFTLP